MNRTRIREWIKLLRSGEFKQTPGALRTGHTRTSRKHCCLGVVCELYSVRVGGFWEENNTFVADYNPELLDYDSETGETYNDGAVDDESSLPSPVREWLDLHHQDEGALINLNDDGYSFSQIADVLELALKSNTGIRWVSDEYRNTHQPKTVKT